MMPARPISWLRRNPRLADALLALALTTISVGAHLFSEPLDQPDGAADPSWWGVALTIVAVAPVAWRRTRPEAALMVAAAGQIAAELTDVSGPGFIGVLVGVYSLAAHSTSERRTRTAVAVGSAIALLLVSGLFAGDVGIDGVFSTTIVLVTAFVVGDNLRSRRLAAAGLAERAERAERERELVAQRRVSDERTRIARELHDVVAHSVSLMVIQAGAARRTLDDAPDTARATLTELEATGRRTMDELRSVLGVLRHDGGEDDAPRAPQPSLADLGDLLDADHGFEIRADVDDHLGDLGPAVELALYRVVQEALTNVTRHAGPVVHVDVAVRRVGDRIRVEVVDDGRGAASLATAGGYGLVGMDERIASIGGSLRAGPAPGGGWRVRAEFPAHDHRPTGELLS